MNAAAKKLNIPNATITRRLKKLEKSLNCKLLSRNSRFIEITIEGKKYYDECNPLINELIQKIKNLDSSFSDIEGKIKILAPINLSKNLLTDAWVSFMKLYPRVKLEIELNNRTENLIEKGYDLAIRIGKQPDSLLNAKKIGTLSNDVFVASPNYLERNHLHEINIRTINEQQLIIAEPLSKWRVIHKKTKEEITIIPQARFRVNEIDLAASMAVAGMGIFFCPKNIVNPYIKNNQLIILFPNWTTLSRDIFAVWHHQDLLPKRIRLLIEHLSEYIKQSEHFNV